MLPARCEVFTAKSFLAPPLTPSKLIIACSPIEGRVFANSVFLDAFAKTPAAPTSAKTFPNTLLGDKSLLFIAKEAIVCLIISSSVKTVPPLVKVLSYGDSTPSNFVFPLGSNGFNIVLIVCSGASSPNTSLAILVPYTSALADISFGTPLKNLSRPSESLYNPETPGIGKLIPELGATMCPYLTGGKSLNDPVAVAFDISRACSKISSCFPGASNFNNGDMLDPLSLPATASLIQGYLIISASRFSA